MRKLIAVAALATMLTGGAAVAGPPGPNGHNDYGLCQAYGSGSQNGQDHKHQAGPFQALQQAADQAGNGDGKATQDEINSYCSNTVPGGKR